MDFSASPPSRPSSARLRSRSLLGWLPILLPSAVVALSNQPDVRGFLLPPITPDASTVIEDAGDDGGTDAGDDAGTDGGEDGGEDGGTRDAGSLPTIHIAVYGAPLSTIVGTPVDFTVAVNDDLGNPQPDYAGTVTFTSDDSAAIFSPSFYTFTALDRGVHTFSRGAIFASEGTHSIRAIDRVSSLYGQQTNITVLRPSGPSIVPDANPVAAVGHPYLYNLARTVTVLGIKDSITYFVRSGPSGFTVDSATGAVRWTPTSPDRYSVSLVVYSPSGVSTPYDFDINVSSSLPPGPTASFTATPFYGLPPFVANFDGSASTSSSGLPLFNYLWDFGDGSPPGTGVFHSHRYMLVGGYVARLTVMDAYGSRDEALEIIEGKGPGLTPPPVARISADNREGMNQMTVKLACNCDPGASTRPIVQYTWDLGNGATAFTPTASATYGPGRYHVTLTVTDSAGYMARDRIELVVAQGDGSPEGLEPPRCIASVDPPVLIPPLSATWTAYAQTGSGRIISYSWELADQSTVPTPSVTKPYSTPGWYLGRLTVRDSNGLTCSDRVVLTATASAESVPPLIVSEPSSTAACGSPYKYSTSSGPTAAGTGTLRWSTLEAPEGFSIDATTGQISWTPVPSQKGPQRVSLRVDGDGGNAEQSFSVDVACAGSLDFSTPFCGCGSSASGPLLAGLALLSVLVRRLRARSQHS